jgi:hypothetical protein
MWRVGAMKLTRLTMAANGESRECGAFEDTETGGLTATVAMGKSPNWSETFWVEINWIDVEEMIAKFAELRNLDALRLLRARKLTAMIDEFVLAFP